MSAPEDLPDEQREAAEAAQRGLDSFLQEWLRAGWSGEFTVRVHNGRVHDFVMARRMQAGLDDWSEDDAAPFDETPPPD